MNYDNIDFSPPDNKNEKKYPAKRLTISTSGTRFKFGLKSKNDVNEFKIPPTVDYPVHCDYLSALPSSSSEQDLMLRVYFSNLYPDTNITDWMYMSSSDIIKKYRELDFWYCFNPGPVSEKDYLILLDDYPINKIIKGKNYSSICCSFTDRKMKPKLSGRINFRGEIIKSVTKEYYEHVRGEKMEVLPISSTKFIGPLSGTGIFITLPEDILVYPSDEKSETDRICLVKEETIIIFTEPPEVNVVSKWSLEYSLDNRKIIKALCPEMKYILENTIYLKTKHKQLYDGAYWSSLVVYFVLLLILIFCERKFRIVKSCTVMILILSVTEGYILANDLNLSEKYNNKRLKWTNFFKKYTADFGSCEARETEFPCVTAEWKPYPYGVHYKICSHECVSVNIKLKNPLVCKNKWQLIQYLGKKMVKSKRKYKKFCKKISKFLVSNGIYGWLFSPYVTEEHKKKISALCSESRSLYDDIIYGYSKYYCITEECWVEWKDSLSELGYVKNYPFPLFFLDDLSINEHCLELPWNYQFYNMSFFCRKYSANRDIDEFFKNFNNTDPKFDNYLDFTLQLLLKKYNYDSIIIDNKEIIKLDHIVPGDPIFNYWEGNPYQQWKDIYYKEDFYKGDKLVTHTDWVPPPWKDENVLPPCEEYNPTDNTVCPFARDNISPGEINFYKKIKDGQYI